jgi:phosphomevalonate kinase
MGKLRRATSPHKVQNAPDSSSIKEVNKRKDSKPPTTEATDKSSTELINNLNEFLVDDVRLDATFERASPKLRRSLLRVARSAKVEFDYIVNSHGELSNSDQNVVALTDYLLKLILTQQE